MTPIRLTECIHCVFIPQELSTGNPLRRLCRHKTMNYTLLYKVYMMQYYRVYRSLNQALLNLFFFGYLFLLFALTARSFFIALTVSVVKTCQIQAPFKSAGAFENPPTSLKTRQVRRVQIRRRI